MDGQKGDRVRWWVSENARLSIWKDTLFGSKHTSAKNNYCSHICDHDSLFHYIICAGGGDVIYSIT